MHALDQRLVIVEGESDALTLWAAGFSALGLPGASNWREEWAGELPEGAQVYVVIEPDSGGKAVLKWLGRSKLAATARLIRMPAERKDPSALYLADPEHFREKFEALIAAAEPFQSDAEAPAGADQFAHLRASIIADLAMGPDAIDDAQPPRWVVEKRIPVAGANLAGSGGAGKTTAILNEYVHIVGGGKLYGCDVIQQGPAVLVTAEDGAEYPRYILQRVLADGVALGSLPERAAQRAKSEIRIVGWSRPKFGPISLVDREGNVTRAPGFDVLLELLAPLNPAAVTLDPAALFSPGERFGNDGESFLAAMMHEAALALGCQFQVLDHVSQNVALSGLVHQHAARGGTAKTDNAQLVKFKAEEAAGSFQPLSIAPEEIAAGRILQLHWTKLNYGPLPPLAWLRRHGHWIENLHAPGREVIDAARRLRAQKVCSEDDALVLASLKQLVAAGLRMSRNELDDVTVLEPDGDKLPRARMRQALHRLISAGIVLEEPLPRAEVRGQRKHFLALRSAL
jgi:RecA-family ATPase